MATASEQALIDECASLREWGERQFFALRSLLLAIESGDKGAVQGAVIHAHQAMGSSDSGTYGLSGYVPTQNTA